MACRAGRGAYFRLDRGEGAPDADMASRYGDRPVPVAPLKGEVHVAGEAIARGGCALAMGLRRGSFADDGLVLVMQAV